jgi:hypothetical protein
MRRLRRITMVALPLLVALALGVKLWLNSASAAGYVAARVADAAGAPVTIGDLEVGWSSSRALNVGVDSWLTLASADIGVSLPQLARGNTSGDVIVKDATATLTFDADNHLTTPLPKPKTDGGLLPRVRLDGGSLTLAFPNRKETFRNLRGELREVSGRATLTGTADDPEWGPWNFTGGATDDGFALTLTTRTPVHVTPALLKRVPFVKPSVWEVVTAEGDTPVEVALRFAPKQPVRYRVTLHPKDTRVYVSTIDLTAEKAAGTVVIEDGVVTLEKVRGKAFNGDLAVDSTMDFRGDGSKMKFAVKATDLMMQQLPQRWRVLRRQGRLNGSADLTVNVLNGETTTSGEGYGEVRLLPALPPFKIHMRADGKGYTFDVGL